MNFSALLQKADHRQTSHSRGGQCESSDESGLPANPMNLAISVSRVPKGQKEDKARNKRKRESAPLPNSSQRRSGFDQDKVFTACPTSGMLSSFSWPAKFNLQLQGLKPEHSAAHATFQGFFEFAGGGAAEIASQGLRECGIQINIRCQSDWGKQKMTSLMRNNSTSCKFGDIMMCVSEESREKLLEMREVVQVEGSDQQHHPSVILKGQSQSLCHCLLHPRMTQTQTQTPQL